MWLLRLHPKMKKRTKSIWRLIAKALGEKSGKDNKEADQIALIRLVMFLSIFVTNGFIIANAIRHWNDGQCVTPNKPAQLNTR